MKGNTHINKGKIYPLKGFLGTGWLGGIGGVYAEGANLFETLMLNWVLYDDRYDLEYYRLFGNVNDIPVWEKDEVPSADMDDQSSFAGPVQAMTWQSRRIRLVPNEERTRVIGVVNCYGDAVTLYNTDGFEKMTAWRRSIPQQKKLGLPTPPHMPVTHDASKALWRGLEPILCVGDDGDFRPGIIRWLEEIRTEVLGSEEHVLNMVTIHAQGMTYGTQSSFFETGIDDNLSLSMMMFRHDYAGIAAVVDVVKRTDKAVTVLTKSKNIEGPWSEPVYLTSSGFDASILHDDDGKKYIVSLEWETREGYEKPGVICCVEYDPETKHVVGYPKRIWRGATDRGCIEAPHLTKRDGWYYIMCAEGGTGYNHSVTMGRSRNVWGPYEPDPNGPLVTSQPKESNERADDDHLKPRYFNPDSVLQKSGHGSYVDLPNGETYLVHLTSRPFVPELRCTLGRETAIQKMQWTSDGWLRMADGSNLAKIEVEEPNLPDVPMPEIPNFDDFDGGELGNWYYSPRQMPSTFANATERPGWLRVRGEESLASLNRTSLLTRKLTSVYATVTTKMEFEPEVYQHSAGLTIYYDNMNNIFLRKYYSQTLGGSAISIVRLENGEKTEMLDTRVAVEDKPIYFRLNIEGRRTWFEWGYDGENWTKIGPDFDTTTFSDEYCKFGEFTGTMVGIAVTDASLHEKTADFDFFDYEADETKPVD